MPVVFFYNLFLQTCKSAYIVPAKAKIMTEQPIEQLRLKYINLSKTIGVDAAISTLHNDLCILEKQVFDGGYKPERLERVQKLRDLSREIWTMQFITDKKK